MYFGEVREILDGAFQIRQLYFVHVLVQRRNSIRSPLQSLALPHNGTELVEGDAGSAADMITGLVTTENEDLIRL